MAAMNTPSTLRDTLLIHWRGNDQPLDWLRIDGNGRTGISVREQAPPASVLAAARQIIVLAPSESITLLAAALPARNAEQARQAAPFAIEEQIAGNVEALHFAVAAKSAGNWWVAAIDPGLLHGWVQAMAARGIVPDRIAPDVMAVLPARDGAVVVIDGERALVRLNGDRAFAVETDLLDSVVIDIADADKREADIGQSALSLLAAGAGRASELNLLGGSFAPAHRGADLRQRWKRIAWFAAAVLVIAMSYLKLDELRLQHRVDALNDEMERIYRERFPEARNVPNPLAQMKNALRAANGGVSADATGLNLLALSAPVLSAQSRVALQGADFRAGALTLRLSAPSIEALDGLRESLAATDGLKATLENAESGADGIEGRIKLEAGS